jgi:hypothetical protein
MKESNENHIFPWNDVDNTAWNSLIVGNGASIAMHREFCYSDLYEVANSQGYLPSSVQIFSNLKSNDFEYVLMACWYAERVNLALGSPSKEVESAYGEVRDGLIKAVHYVHPAHAVVSSGLENVAVFAKKFPTIISLNYDLMLYWAMLQFNEKNEIWFKDAFIKGEFQKDFGYLRNPHPNATGASLVFYPHGSLSFARDYFGKESKISASSGGLIEAITDGWISGEFIPIFVSEGTSEQKVSSIRRSRYLSAVYEDVLPKLGHNVVVYGWSFEGRDQHVLEAIAKNPPSKIAVSVYTDQPVSRQQEYCYQVRAMVKKFLPKTSVIFYDSRSSGCWNNP